MLVSMAKYDMYHEGKEKYYRRSKRRETKE